MEYDLTLTDVHTPRMVVLITTVIMQRNAYHCLSHYCERAGGLRSPSSLASCTCGTLGCVQLDLGLNDVDFRSVDKQ